MNKIFMILKKNCLNSDCKLFAFNYYVEMLSFITFEIYACVYLFYQEISINVISSTFFLLGNTLKDNLTYLVDL